eukprot:SAG22_NODE_804_length_7097_cov_173.117176_3_plen_76_part_00
MPLDTTNKPYELDDFDGATGAGRPLTTGNWQPPPGASTVYLLGAQNATALGYGPRFLNLSDAPEGMFASPFPSLS